MEAQSPAADAPRPASAPQGAAPAVQVGGRGASEGSETLPIQVAAPAAVPAEAPVVARSALSGAALEEVRREAMRVITEEVGPLGASLVARLERARNGDELRRLLESASVVVGSARGDEAAAAFRARFMH